MEFSTRWQKISFRRTKTGFRQTKTGFRRTKTSFRRTKIGFRRTNFCFRQTKIGFRRTQMNFRQTCFYFRLMKTETYIFEIDFHHGIVRQQLTGYSQQRGLTEVQSAANQHQSAVWAGQTPIKL